MIDTRGSSLSEYAIITGAIAATVLTSVGALGDNIIGSYDSNTLEAKETRLVNTGFVSDFADKKVLGIAEDYTGEITFIFEEAGFRNALGMYKFDRDGTIQDIRIIFANASAKGSGGDLVPGESSVTVALEERDQIGFFVASNAYRKNDNAFLTEGSYALLDENGDPATIFSEDLLTLWHKDPQTDQMHAIRTQYARNLFYSHGDPEKNYRPNADRFPHTVGWIDKETGIVTLGFEDLKSGGDKDYDDIILEFDVGRSNAIVLDPNINYEFTNQEDWAQRLGLFEK